MRGNRRHPGAPDRRAGPTPARAGQPSSRRPPRSASRAYPRACGATSGSSGPPRSAQGLPPRVRGNRSPRCGIPLSAGPTPARAGQPSEPSRGHYLRGAYPRACGATASVTTALLIGYGLPPRVRGNRFPSWSSSTGSRPTPARAGQPTRYGSARGVPPAYPRACGATRRLRGHRVPPGGLPPRVRGNRLLDAPQGVDHGPTPARAGQPPSRLTGETRAAAYPRACGATADLVDANLLGYGLPPRVRGNLDRLVRDVPGPGPTPARAGQPREIIDRLDSLDGLPPRVRGNRTALSRTLNVPGPTPARAGQPAR